MQFAFLNRPALSRDPEQPVKIGRDRAELADGACGVRRQDAASDARPEPAAPEHHVPDEIGDGEPVCVGYRSDVRGFLSGEPDVEPFGSAYAGLSEATPSLGGPVAG